MSAYLNKRELHARNIELMEESLNELEEKLANHWQYVAQYRNGLIMEPDLHKKELIQQELF